MDHSSRTPKIRFFLKLIIFLLIPPVFIKIFLSFSPQTQLLPQTNTRVSVTPYITTKPAPPLTQATLDDWSKKLASGSEADLRSVVEIPKNQSLFPEALKTISSFAPFHFKLETFKKNADNTTGSIEVEIGSADRKKTVLVYLQVINGAWKIVNIKM